jgi:hypothetical protein
MPEAEIFKEATSGSVILLPHRQKHHFVKRLNQPGIQIILVTDFHRFHQFFGDTNSFAGGVDLDFFASRAAVTYVIGVRCPQRCGGSFIQYSLKGLGVLGDVVGCIGVGDYRYLFRFDGVW